MAHHLLLDVSDSIINNQFILVRDLSVWDDMLAVNNLKLKIKPPFADDYELVTITAGAVKSVTAIDLGLASDLCDLPDGPYEFVYSVSPNDKVSICFVHYRIAGMLNSVLAKMVLTRTGGCIDCLDDCGNVELSKQENTLLHIYSLLKGVQACARDSYFIPRADELYRAAFREYERLFDIENCKGC